MFCQKCGKEKNGGAGFCNNCGNPFDGAPVAQPAQTPSEAKALVGKIKEVIVNVIKKPATTMSNFSKEGDFKTALGIMGLFSCVMLFAALILILFAVIKLGDALEYIELPIVPLIISSITMPFGLSALLAGILLFVNNVIFKGKNTYKQMLCVAASASLAVAAGIAVATVLGFLIGLMSIPFANIIITLFIGSGVILALYLTGASYKGICEYNDDKRLWVLTLSFIITLVAICLLSSALTESIMILVGQIVSGSLMSSLTGLL